MEAGVKSQKQDEVSTQREGGKGMKIMLKAPELDMGTRTLRRKEEMKDRKFTKGVLA